MGILYKQIGLPMGTSLPFKSFRSAYNWISNFKMHMIIVFSCLFLLANSMAVEDVEKRAVAETSEDLSKRIEEDTDLLLATMQKRRACRGHHKYCYGQLG